MTSEIQLLLQEAAVDGDAIPLSLDQIMRAGRRRRRITSALMATTVMATVAVVGAGGVLLSGKARVVGGVGGTGPSAGRQPDVTISSSGTITAIFHDPEATAATLNKFFLDRGLKITIDLVASSPSLVGHMGSFGGNQGDKPLTPIDSDQSCGYGRCTVGVTVPAGFDGTMTLDIGRAAAPDEAYQTSTDATTPGEALACTNIIGSTVEAAERIVAARHLTASWRGLADKSVDPKDLSGQLVVDVTSTALGKVDVKSEPTAEFDAYPAKNQPCYPSAVARAG